MNETKKVSAFGAPGMEPRWTRSTKEGIGTAYHSSCRIWFTLSHGILNEIYYPNVDCPNTRDLQFLITDGETFCHEERRDLDHKIEYPEKSTLYYRLTNTDPGGRYRVVKEIITDPHSSVLLMKTRLEVIDEDFKNKLKIYALLSPHLKGLGQNNSAWWNDVDCRPLFHAEREGVHMAFGGWPDFTRRSVGYVGQSDGWQDLMENYRMDWEFTEAVNGNIALTAEIDLSRGSEFVIAVAFGRSSQSASTKLLQSLATPFEQHRDSYIKQWKRVVSAPEAEAKAFTGDDGSLFRLSRLVLLAHEDKVYPGALVASMSIPWGETKGDGDLGGYHLVWTRDMVKSACALLASGQTATPLRSLIWLACVQGMDGSMPQNSWIDGDAYWHGKQLDEVAAPILLAWRLQKANALGLFDPWTLVLRAARYLVLHGPITGQERWEENSGYSPSTLAWIIASLVCVADFARAKVGDDAANFFLDHADWMSAHLEEWTVTTRGELVPGKPRHYVRINPADANQSGNGWDVNTATLQIANGGGEHPARNVVSGDFIELVRLGIRDAKDKTIVDSIAVIDAVLKYDLPQGPGWRRYNYDGYGQKDDGGPYDGTGTGRCWPLLTGERGHYELAAGRDARPYIEVLEKFANEGGMLTEQVWDAEDLPEARMKKGGPTGSAMPLCWAHGEYLTLVRSYRDKVGFDRIDPVYERYAKRTTQNKAEIWSFAHQPPVIRAGKQLRIILAEPGTVRWSRDSWASFLDTEARDSGLGCWYADIETEQVVAGNKIDFTIRWSDRWEGRNFQVKIGGS